MLPASTVRFWPRQQPQVRRTHQSKRQELTVDQNGVILKGYDPVAYFKQHRAVKGDPKSYGGATYYFASTGDKAAFDESPVKYAPQYGGYCVSGMTKGQLNDCDPSVFFITRENFTSAQV